MFQSYRDAGLCVIPLRGGVPVVKWGKYTEELPGKDVAEKWEGHKEYALVCGKVSGVIALDIDTNDQVIIAKIETLAGTSPVKKVGSKGYTAFYKYSGEKTQSWGGVVEILSDKHLTTIPPSKHRNKKNVHYTWVAQALIGAELPALPPAFCSVMDALYPKPKQENYERVNYTERHVELQDAERMLSFISPDCSREEWVRVGMALRDEYGDMALWLWHSWSAGSPKYKRQDAQSAWRSFHGNGITIGTLVKMAKDNGFFFEQPTVEVKREEPKEVQLRPEIRAHGLVQDIADWITSCAIRPQPQLSLAAALGFVGMLKGHSICGKTDLRTNLLIMSLAPTSSGKEHPQYCISKLVKAAKIGHHIMGEPVSGTGFLNGLNKCGRIGLLMVDEMGRYMANAMDSRAASHQKEIIDYMIKTFSCANRELKGKQYANDKTSPPITLDQPHFCCVGSTVVEKFAAACTSSEVIDGFLNRWILFDSNTRPALQDNVSYEPPSNTIIDRVTILADPRGKSDKYGDPSPKQVKFTPEAWQIFKDYREKIERELNKASYPMSSLIGRSCEHVEKIAMTLCDNEDILQADVLCAIKIVEQSNINISRFTHLLSDNAHEQDFVKVKEIIKKSGSITRAELTRRTQFLAGGKRRREEIIESLYDCQIIRVEQEVLGNKGVIFHYVGD